MIFCSIVVSSAYIFIYFLICKHLVKQFISFLKSIKTRVNTHLKQAVAHAVGLSADTNTPAPILGAWFWRYKKVSKHTVKKMIRY